MTDLNRQPRLLDLTHEELEVAYFVGQGFWGWQLAEQLSVRQEEAEHLVSSVMEKLGLTGRLELWMYAKMQVAEAPFAHA